MSAAFLAAAEVRRTNYAITAESTLSNAELQNLVEACVKQTPEPFNAQAVRAVLVVGEKHGEVWNLVQKEMINAMSELPAQVRDATAAKMGGFAKGYGTVLFYENSAVIADTVAKHPAFLAPHFPGWMANSSGILKFLVWTALTNEGLGASLQHNGSYTPGFPAGLSELFGVPETWTSTGLMPFGKPSSAPLEKTLERIEERVVVFGA